MQTSNSVVIIGGGLAGLISGIHLAKNGLEVTILEKNEFPKHKVCGEYISNEVLPYLKSLQLDIDSLQPKAIQKICLSLQSGKTITTKLPLGGFGISRYTLDYYLFEQAKKCGCTIKKEVVEKIVFIEDLFLIATNATSYQAKVVLGAFGKRSNLDIDLNREFIKKKSNYLGVKAHYKLNYPSELVGLHHFNGGYCGVSKVENDMVNICYLANYDSFKKYKSISEYQDKVVFENPNLKEIFKNATLQFEKPLTISQISFDKKECVKNHILMVGDTAGLIHPLCGNGMAMAIHSAKLVSESTLRFFESKLNRNELEREYTKKWNYNFKNRLKTGRYLEYLLQKEKWANFILKILTIFPFILPIIIKKTHGKPL